MKKKILFLLLSLTIVSCKNNETEKPIKKILFVVTSNDKLGDTGGKTGFWIEELVAPYYAFTDIGIQIDIATPLGGRPPIDPRSEDPSAASDATERFDKDTTLLEKLKKTLKLSEVDEKEYDAVFYPGGHGPLWDLVDDKNSIAIIEAFHNNKKPIAFVCHAPAVLKNVKNANGDFLIKDKKITGFSNTEEEAVGLTKIVPFSLEDVLQENGGIYSKIENWKPYVVEDGLLITGQNPASSLLVAEKLLAQLNVKE